MLFEGWVPNATGNLSFTAIGDALKNTAISNVQIRQHFTNGDKRWLVCAQARTNPDPWLWRWVIKIANRALNLFRPTNRRRLRHDTLTYVMTGVTEKAFRYEEGKIVGRVSILNPTPSIYKRSLLILKRKASELNREAQSARFTPSRTRGMSSDWNNFENDIKLYSIFTCEFTLLRNGKCFIDADMANLPAQAFKYLVDQCYYYLKDCVHSHYHHDSKTDAILEIIEKRRGSDWRIKVFRNLYRKIIFLRKLNNERKLSDALGILAYANNFKEIFGDCDFNKNGVKYVKPTIAASDSSLEKSIKIVLDKLKAKREQAIVNAQVILATTLSIVALYVSIGSSLDENSKGKIFFKSINSYISKHPESLIYVLIVVPSIYLLLMALNNGDVWIERSTYKIIAWLNKWQYMAIGALFSLIVAAYAYYILSFAVSVPIIYYGRFRPEFIHFLNHLFEGTPKQ